MFDHVDEVPEPQHFSPSGRTLYFWHIPKTAGTSLTSWLNSQYHPESIYIPNLLDDFFDDRWQWYFGRCALLRGHFADAPLRHWPSPLDSITVLRQPVARGLSHLAHVERDETNPLNGRLRACRGDLTRVLDDPVLRQLVENVQTRWLGLPWRRNMASRLDLGTVDPALVETLRYQHANDSIDRRIFARALYRLDAVTHVGTTERLPHFMSQVAASFRWPHTEPPRENVRPAAQSLYRAEVLSSSDLRRLKRLNLYDAALYRYARVRATTPPGLAGRAVRVSRSWFQHLRGAS